MEMEPAGARRFRFAFWMERFDEDKNPAASHQFTSQIPVQEKVVTN